uniref:X8 domain-containing protein n=1 Tax=Oryza glaberrima TaxID=4538 RepID=I1PYB0_ORYGL
MDLWRVHCLGWLLVLLLFSHEAAGGGGAEQVATQAHHDASRRLAAQVAHGTPERDVTSPLATVPVDNPAANPTVTSTTNPAAMPGTQTTPSLANPVAAGGGGGGGGGSWCVASPSASTAALQVALDYACGQGGVDCSAIQSGGGCFNPNTVHDHASFAFNSYYQKNPVQTSCDFAGTAILTSTDPNPFTSRCNSAGSSSCKYPSTSTGASVLNTSTPTNPAFGGYDNSPPGFGNNSPPLYGSMSPPGYNDNIGAAAAMAGSKETLLSLACVVATVSLNLYK